MMLRPIHFRAVTTCQKDPDPLGVCLIILQGKMHRLKVSARRLGRGVQRRAAFWGTQRNSRSNEDENQLPSTFGGFLKWGHPPNHPFLLGIFHYKPSIWGYPHPGKPTFFKKYDLVPKPCIIIFHPQQGCLSQPKETQNRWDMSVSVSSSMYEILQRITDTKKHGEVNKEPPCFTCSFANDQTTLLSIEKSQLRSIFRRYLQQGTTSQPSQFPGDQHTLGYHLVSSN